MVLGQAVLSLGLIVSVIFFRSRLQANDQFRQRIVREPKTARPPSYWQIARARLQRTIQQKLEGLE